MREKFRSREAAMPFIMLAVLLDMAAIGVIIPVLPALVGSFSDNQADQAYWYGVAAVAFGLANFLAAPVLGALSDRYGRRPVLLLGFMGLGVSFFGTALSTSLWGLIAVRTLGGVMQANAAIANAYVADISAPEERAKRFGLLGAMMGLGFIVGPVMGGLLGAIDLHLPFYVAGGLTLLNCLYGYFVLPESLPPAQRKAFSWRSANPATSLRKLGQLKGVGPLVGVVAFSALAQFVLYTVWVLYNSFKFGWGPQENGWSLAVVGIVAVLVQGVLMGRLLKRYAPPKLAIMGLVSSVIAYTLWGAATEGWMMYAVIAFNLLGGTVTASVQSMISSAADSKSQGQTMGAVSALSSLMAVLAPMMGAPLLAMVSHLPQGDWRIGAPFFFCAVLQVASLALAVMHLRRHRRRHNPPQ
ncbi:MFS transporter [Limnohabitans sp. Bal53]|jgi:MFS transporter, DHA1 family, tetracycline resistance protein|uniref:MFS transporter n=1 Tax=Limnohabitans sp. Bal53 TaxID=1977910 RepID=UPI001E2E8A37|nr:MFS transporter [Limnohabitans sp. Bal53]MDP4733926.1 MFS transporter [Limnohabitans sp.]